MWKAANRPGVSNEVNVIRVAYAFQLIACMYAPLLSTCQYVASACVAHTAPPCQAGLTLCWYPTSHITLFISRLIEAKLSKLTSRYIMYRG